VRTGKRKGKNGEETHSAAIGEKKKKKMKKKGVWVA
jgi:hypothetical protein